MKVKISDLLKEDISNELKTANLKADNLLKSSPYKDLFGKFVKDSQLLFDSFQKSAFTAIKKCEKRLEQCEDSLDTYLTHINLEKENNLVLADKLVRKEMRSKVIISQWANSFLVSTSNHSPNNNTINHEENAKPLDPITFAIIRYCLNVALNYQDISPEYIIECKIHQHLIQHLQIDNNLVKGPSLLALIHLSLYPTLKPLIVTFNNNILLNTLLKISIEMTSSPLILTLVCKLIASLSLEVTNKGLITSSGCLHSILDLLLGFNYDEIHDDTISNTLKKDLNENNSNMTIGTNKNLRLVNDNIQIFALSSLINLLYQYNSNRILIVECDGIRPLIKLLKVTVNDKVLVLVAKCLANISYLQKFSSNDIIKHYGGHNLAQWIINSDLGLPYNYNNSNTLNNALVNSAPVETNCFNSVLVVHSCLAALSNLCFSEMNQTLIGSLEGLMEATIRICENAKQIYLVTEAANFMIACTWRNSINKSRMGSKGACAVLVKRILHHCNSTDQKDLICTERLCLALSSILMYQSNHERVIVNGNLAEIAKVCKLNTNPTTLRSLSKIFIPLIPSPEELLHHHKDQTSHIIETVQTLQILRKVKVKGYVGTHKPPAWLDYTINYLAMTDEQLDKAPVYPFSKQEFVDQLFFSKEFSINIYPDTSPNNNSDFTSLTMSFY